jgi:type II secretory pathway component PulM
MIKDWLNSLSKRDRMALNVCAAFCGVCFLIFFIISPLLSQFSHLEQENIYKRNLLAWMEMANKQLTKLSTKKEGSQDLPLLEAISKSIQDNELREFHHDIQQDVSSQKAKVQFKQLPFPYLIVWLTVLAEKYHIVVDSVDLTPVKEGVVRAELTLEKKV